MICNCGIQYTDFNKNDNKSEIYGECQDCRNKTYADNYLDTYIKIMEKEIKEEE